MFCFKNKLIRGIMTIGLVYLSITINNFKIIKFNNI